MNYLVSLLLILPFFCLAQEQEPLEFDTKYYACEDQWVVFPKEATDFTHLYGFIYLDEEAGFTFNLEGKLEVNDAGQLMAVPKEDEENASIKIRLQPTTSLVAVLSSKQLEELKLPKEPEWLHFYKKSDDEIASLLARGYHYNHVGASELALPYLKEAYEKKPILEGLAFELAYAYNATEQHKKATDILIKALNQDPKNYFFYRELGFAQVRLGQIKEAEKTYEKGIRLSNDAYQKSEMGINMTQAYFKLKDKKGFKKWAKITRKYAPTDTPFLRYISYWEKELK
ncbi:MAG: tetratricopeptide repeat protein [Aureispira sp.]